MNAKSIVVGVDGSVGSRQALDYALDEAVLREASVRVVTVFDSLAAFGAPTAFRSRSLTPSWPIECALRRRQWSTRLWRADRTIPRCG